MEMAENLNQKEPKLYEIGYLLSPLVAEASVADTVNSVIRTTIEKAGGTVTIETAPAMRPLAYEVKKEIGSKITRYTDAYFGAIRFNATPDAIARIKESLDRAEQLLRFMIIIAPKDNPVKVRRVGAKAPADSTVEGDKTVAPMTTADIDKEIDGLLAKV